MKHLMFFAASHLVKLQISLMGSAGSAFQSGSLDFPHVGFVVETSRFSSLHLITVAPDVCSASPKDPICVAEGPNPEPWSLLIMTTLT